MGRRRPAPTLVLAVLAAIATLPMSTLAQAGPEDVGAWGPLDLWPAVAIHASLLPNGQVLFWQNANGAFLEPGFQETTTYLWDPISDVVTEAANVAPSDMFCAAHASLADGRIISTGGHVAFLDGIKEVNIYDPATETWEGVAPMSMRRWYPTTLSLPDGQVLVVGGHISPANGDPLRSSKPALIPEIYNPERDQWTRLENSPLALHSYPFLFVLPDGRIFQAKTSTTRTLDLSTGIWTVVDTTPNENPVGSAAMYRLGQVLKSGGENPATNAADVINMADASPAWRAVPPMIYPRHDHNLVLLPDGDVLAVGGSEGQNEAVTAVLEAELWDPNAETWTEMAAMDPDPRMYHSTALLLPDGRILAAGGDNYPSRQVYSPPYLFKGARPTVSAVPSAVRYNTSFDVVTPDSASIASVAWMRPGSVTHAVDMNQRYLSLDFTVTASGLTVSSPDNANHAPPGFYMLFVVNNAGVPSVAEFVELNGACSDGVDDDGDGLIDYPQDPGCQDASDTSERDPSVACDDGNDNDGDGFVDFSPIPGLGDPGCADPSGASELPVDYACSDGIDNDGDGRIDYVIPAGGGFNFVFDPGCSALDDPSERALPPCADGLDNDQDGFIDFPDDPQCTSPAWGLEGTQSACSDGIDNDGDGKIDFGLAFLGDGSDPECTSPSDGSEEALSQCSDGIDNDGDGKIDWGYPSDSTADRQCGSPSDDREGPACDDGLDGDDDGLIDFPQDPGCADLSGAESFEVPQCEDHLDNDGDGLVDYPADPGCSSPSSNIERPQCEDGIDNDGDGDIDLADSECSSVSDDIEAPNVLMIGDSITHGETGDYQNGDVPYVDVAAIELNGAVNLTNLGCGGTTSIDWDPASGLNPSGCGFVDTWTTQVEPNLPAEAAVVMLGTNDSLGFFEPGSVPVSIENYGLAMDNVVSALLGPGGVEDVMLMTPPSRCTSVSQATRDLLYGYRLEVLDMCVSNPQVLCGPDVHELLDPSQDFPNCNDLHPTGAGHETLGEALAEDLAEFYACTLLSTPMFDACAPVVNLLADGNPVVDSITVTPGSTVQFDINATDPDGIGFPVFAQFGLGHAIPVIWDFDTAADDQPPLTEFNPTPAVIFNQAPGEPAETLNLSANVFDGSGKSTRFEFEVFLNDTPDVSVLADGVPITGPLSVVSGTEITFEAIATDEDGLGFPVFAFLGSNVLISYVWELDGATLPGPLYTFYYKPPVTFELAPGEDPRAFNVILKVFDTFGGKTTIPITVNVTSP